MLERIDERRTARFLDLDFPYVLKAVDDELVWMLGPHGLVALDWRTGEPCGGIDLRPAPIGFSYQCHREGSIWLFRSSDGRVVDAYDQSSGRKLWSHQDDAFVRTIVTARDGRFLVLGTRNQLTLAWVDAATGVLEDELVLPGSMRFVPARAACSKHELVLLNDDRELCCVELEPLRLAWSRPLADLARVDRALAPVMVGDRIVLATVAEADHGPVTVLSSIDPVSSDLHPEAEIDGETDRVEANHASVLAFFTGPRGSRFAMQVSLGSSAPPLLLEAPKGVAAFGPSFLLLGDGRVDLLFQHGSRSTWLSGALPPGALGAPHVASGKGFFTLGHRLFQIDCRPPLIAVDEREHAPLVEHPRTFGLVLEPIARHAGRALVTPRAPREREPVAPTPLVRALDSGRAGAVVLPPPVLVRERAKFADALRLAPIEDELGAALPRLLRTILERSDRDLQFAARLHRLGLYLEVSRSTARSGGDTRLVDLAQTSDDDRLGLLWHEGARAMPVVAIPRGREPLTWVAPDFDAFFSSFLRERARFQPALVEAVRATLALDDVTHLELPGPPSWFNVETAIDLVEP